MMLLTEQHLKLIKYQETLTLSKQLAYYEEYQKKLVGSGGKANASSKISGSVNLISSGSSDFVESSYINPLLYKNYTPDQFSDILIQSYATFVQNLRRVLEESAPVLVTARHDAEERRTNICLSEEQDAACRAAALEADQAREWLLKEEQEQLAREAAEAERKRKEEEEAHEREACESAEKESALARLRQEKASHLELSLNKDLTSLEFWCGSQLESERTGGSIMLQLSSHCMTMLTLSVALKLRVTALSQIFLVSSVAQISSLCPRKKQGYIHRPAFLWS